MPAARIDDLLQKLLSLFVKPAFFPFQRRGDLDVRKFNPKRKELHWVISQIDPVHASPTHLLSGHSSL